MSDHRSAWRWVLLGWALLIPGPALFWLTAWATSVAFPKAGMGGLLPAILLAGAMFLGSMISFIIAAILHFSGKLRSDGPL